MKDRRTDSHTAAILMAMFVNWGKARMRISRRTLKLIARRKILRQSFVSEVRGWVEECDAFLVELDEGRQGYCMVKKTALSGVAPYSLEKFSSDTDFDLNNEDELWEFVTDYLDEEEERED